VENKSQSPISAPPDNVGTTLSRALSLKCPLCGKGELFDGWIQMKQKCETCDFRFERDPGYFLGSTYINYGLTTLITTCSYIVLRFLMGIEQRWLIPGLATFCIIFPLVFFGYARSLWLSLDCYFDRTGALEVREESRTRPDPKTSKEN
jgi:uncharacterized protein (DUF983 family)